MRKTLPRARLRMLLWPLVVVAAIVGLTSAPPAVTAGDVNTIQLAASPNPVALTLGQTAVLAVGASNIAAGDTIQRILDLTNSGTADVASITLTTTSSTANRLTQNPPPSGPYQGLGVVIDECSVAWQKAPTTYVFSCPGTITPVLSSRPVLMANTSLGFIQALHHGSTDRLRITVNLPAAAGNLFETLTSAITYSFSASTDPAQPECAGMPFDATIVGTSGNDALNGSSGNKNDVIFGLQGNDTIDGKNGNDCVVAGDGNNSVTASSGSVVLAGTGTDSITIGSGGNATTKVYTGGRTSSGAPVSAGATTTNAGNGGAAVLNILGGNGNDTIFLANGSGTVDGGGGTNVCHVPKLNKVGYTITNCPTVSP